MSEDAAIRRANLKLLCARRGWGPSDLHAAIGEGVYSYWRDLLTDPKKSFGEKSARRIEDKLGLGRGWLDHDRDGPYPVAAEPTVLTTGARDAPVPALPFSAPLVAALRACDPIRIGEMENALRALLHMPVQTGAAPATRPAGEFDFRPPPAPEVKKALKRARRAPKSGDRRTQK